MLNNTNVCIQMMHTAVLKASEAPSSVYKI